MTSSRAVTRRAALAAFLLFAAGLFVVGPVEASRTTTDLRTIVAPPLELTPSSLEPVALVEPIDAAPRFGFGEDLGLLDPEADPGGFVVFERETSQYELTYARNNPLKYVDPDGKLALEAAAVAAAKGAATGITVSTAGGALLTVGALCIAIDLVRPNSHILNGIADLVVNGLRAEQADDADGKAEGNTNPYKGPVAEPVTVTDPAGNAIRLSPGQQVHGSPDGKYQQVKDSSGKPTGTRLDAGGHASHKPGEGREGHAHVVRPDGTKVTTETGSELLPIRRQVDASTKGGL